MEDNNKRKPDVSNMVKMRENSLSRWLREKIKETEMREREWVRWREKERIN